MLIWFLLIINIVLLGINGSMVRKLNKIHHYGWRFYLRLGSAFGSVFLIGMCLLLITGII